MEVPTPRVLARWVGALVLGAVIGVVGTGLHRWERPWGLVLAVCLVALGAVVARAWVGGAGVLAAGLGVVTATAMLAAPGPGGDVIVAADGYGYGWYLGGFAVVVALVLPRRWFAETVEQGD